MPKKSSSKKKSTAAKTIKKSTGTKTSKKSTGTKGKKVKISPEKKKLIARLNVFMEILREEDLEFLLSQAEVMDYNRRIRERAENMKDRPSLKPEDFEIKKPDRGSVEIIEGEGGNHFIIAGAGVRKFFDIQEMRKLVKLCHAASDRKDAAIRLFTWLDKNRRDYINDAEISGPGDILLGTIYDKIVATYTVRE